MIPAALREMMTAAVVADWATAIVAQPEPRMPWISRVGAVHRVRVLEEQPGGGFSESVIEVPMFVFWMGRADRAGS